MPVSQPEGPRTTFLGKLVVLLFIGACGYGAYHFFVHKPASGASPSAGGLVSTLNKMTGSGPAVEFGLAYGTEKKRWLEWAVQEFAKTPDGQRITVKLIPKGSLEGAQALLAGDKSIHVWSPASSLYRDTFVQDWQVRNGGNPILKEEALALSPMVFVTWSERYEEFIKKYGVMNFNTTGQALQETGGWNAIAAKPEWGFYKLGHTHPNESNSGLMALVLFAYDYHKKTKGLTLKDILDVGMQTALGGFERGVSGLSNSTGNMMKEMVLKGPASYDTLLVYENVVIDYLKNAEGRWGELHISYPKYNLWNDNPYYIIDAPWNSPEQRKAEEIFMEFLLSEPVQKQSLAHGFRPGNPAVPIRFPDSPFVIYEKFGLKLDVGQICEAPKGEVIQNLLAGWQRTQGNR
jgi:hypothetical protein